MSIQIIVEYFIIAFALLPTVLAGKSQKKGGPFRVVFVHTSIPGSCGPFTEQFKAAIKQAHRTQSNQTTEVVILSNFKQCRWSKHDIQTTMKPTPTLVDAVQFRSKKTHEFEKLLKSTIEKSVNDEDIVHTSLYRYLMLEDYMVNRSISQIVSLETDTMVYGDVYSMVPHLRRTYPKMAVSPTVHKKMTSSAFMWVGNITALRKFNDFLVKLNRNETGEFSSYINWLRDFSCCKPVGQGGIYADASGAGLKPWAVSDMTMMSYYRHLHHREIKLLPLLPRGNYHSHASFSKDKSLGMKAHTNLTAFSQGGAEVGGNSLIPGIFDTSKYGWIRQYMNDRNNGSSVSSGSDETATAGTSKDLHGLMQRSIIEQASLKFNCTVEMKCSGRLYQRQHQKGAVISAFKKPLSSDTCFTGPHVSCSGTMTGTVPGDAQQWTPLWYLHIPKNSKFSTEEFVSKQCSCSTAAS